MRIRYLVFYLKESKPQYFQIRQPTLVLLPHTGKMKCNFTYVDHFSFWHSHTKLWELSDLL